jgi:hypothetical protein
MDENLNISDTAQLAVVIRVVFQDFMAEEGMQTVLPLKGRTREDIYQAFKISNSTADIPLISCLCY